MYIHEAIKVSAGGRIRQKSWPSHWEMLPTNTIDCCVIYGPYTPEGARRWSPSCDDLLADDWEVAD